MFAAALNKKLDDEEGKEEGQSVVMPRSRSPTVRVDDDEDAVMSEVDQSRACWRRASSTHIKLALHAAHISH